MKCIDADSHILPINMFQYVDSKYQSRLPDYVFLPDGRLDSDHPITVDPNTYSMNPLLKQGYNDYGGRSNIDSRLMDMSDMGVDMQMLNPDDHAIRFSYLVEVGLAREMAYSYNRTVKSIVDQHPNRFLASLMLPLQDMEWSLREIDWAADAGFTSIIIDNCWPTHRSPISEPLAGMLDIDDLFAKCVEKDMTIIVHSQMHHRTLHALPMLKRYGLREMYPNTNQASLVSLVMKDVIDRHPDVRLLFSEGGMQFIMNSVIYLERMGKVDARKYFGKNFFFTIESESKKMIRTIVNELGADCLLFATDYPHDDPGGSAKFQDHENIMNLNIMESDRIKITSGNAQKLFKVDYGDVAQLGER